MEYKRYGKHEISVLGIGLFQAQSLTRDFDRCSYFKALSRGLEVGVNYIDLGFPMFAKDDTALISECGGLLKKSTAVRVLRVNIWQTDTPAAIERFVLRDLQLYGLDRVTYLQLDGINRTQWPKLRENGMLSRAQELVRWGIADGLTFYFTDDRFYLRPILDEGVFDGITLDYSLMDLSRNPGSFKTAADYGLGIVAYGATKDGRLTENIPDDTRAVWKERPERTPDGWAIGIALDRPEISSVLLEFMNPDQVDVCAGIAERSVSDPAGVAGLLIGKRIKDIYSSKRAIQCELCRSCMPCPLGVNAPRIAELYNEYLMFGDVKIPAAQYQLEGLGNRQCVQCGQCRRKCPRKFPLDEIVPTAHDLFSNYERSV